MMTNVLSLKAERPETEVSDKAKRRRVRKDTTVSVASAVIELDAGYRGGALARCFG